MTLKLYKTLLERYECLRQYKGYTEFNGERYALRQISVYPPFEHNAIIFGYEYDKYLAETGFTHQAVNHILRDMTSTISQFPTLGGYVNQEGHTIEEKGMILVYDHEISPVALGSLAHKIAETFRQESVLVIYNQQAEFVYA